MYFTVEPREGTELERLVTALLNATFTVHRLVEDSERALPSGGLEIINRCAERMHSALSLLAEHHDDEELALVTGVVGACALLLAEDLGLDCYD